MSHAKGSCLLYPGTSPSPYSPISSTILRVTAAIMQMILNPYIKVREENLFRLSIPDQKKITWINIVDVAAIIRTLVFSNPYRHFNKKYFITGMNLTPLPPRLQPSVAPLRFLFREGGFPLLVQSRASNTCLERSRLFSNGVIRDFRDVSPFFN